MTVSSRSHQGKEQVVVDRGKIEWILSAVNTRTVLSELNELIDEFKMAAGDVFNVGSKL